jgi:hypothetical protein
VAVVTPWCGNEYGRTPTSSVGVRGGALDIGGEGFAGTGVVRVAVDGGAAAALSAEVVTAGVSIGADGDGIASHVPTATAARARAMTGRRPGRITRGSGAT